MVCNIGKTEMMLLGNEEKDSFHLDVDGTRIMPQKTIKVLGVTFDSDLKWTTQVEKTVKRTSRMLHGLKCIRKFLNAEQAKSVMTAYYFSSLYYGIEIWFHRGLSFHLKQKIRSAH